MEKLCILKNLVSLSKLIHVTILYKLTWIKMCLIYYFRSHCPKNFARVINCVGVWVRDILIKLSAKEDEQ